MITNETQKQIIKKVEELLKINIIDVQIPAQGLDNEVLAAIDSKGNEFIVKFGVNAINDAIVLTLIEKNKINIPVPRMLGHFSIGNRTVVIMEKINFPSLRSISNEHRSKYIGSMIANLKKIHSIRSNIAGHINKQDNAMTWKEFLLFKYSGKHLLYDWDEILLRDGVDASLIKAAVKAITEKIAGQEFFNSSHSLLHNDFHSINLFVDPKSDEITGIIDWGDAIFGDPLYDFARLRMYIWESNFKSDALENYYKLLALTDEEKKLEELYFLSRIIEYINWFSLVKSDFYSSVLKLHQDFLREYDWR